MTRKNTLRLAAAIVTAVVLGLSMSAAAAGPGPKGCECADIYAPVICSNGVVYGNPCMADCAGATGCVPYNP